MAKTPTKPKITVEAVYTWTCPECGVFNESQEDPKEEEVNCAGCGVYFEIAELGGVWQKKLK